MSMVQQLIQAVTVAQRQIDDQATKLQAYNGQVDRVIQQVQSELSGSTQQYAAEMLQQLQQTKQQVSDTLGKLSAAKEKLTQVRMI